MSDKVKIERPKCQDKENWFSEPCQNPAKFVKRAPAGIWLVCGLCARKYQATALSPFRMKDWRKIQRELSL